MDNWFLYVSGALTAIYGGLILVYRYWFNALKPFAPQAFAPPSVYFTVIIPARNEAANIQACLNNLFAQDYPLFEILVVDDFSTDETAQLVQQMALANPRLQLIQLKDHVDANATNSFKKKAIEIAVSQSKGTWIVTTDADCLVPPNWLHYYNTFITAVQPVFVAAPVMFTNNRRFSGIFQLLDFLSLQGISAAAVSAGAHSMCNGANLAYSKTAFEAVGQFAGIDHLASGDDMLLMHKMKKAFPGQLAYLFAQDAIVFTSPMPDWSSFIQQRIRWASKADSYQDKAIFSVLLLVYLFNAALLVGLIWGMFNTTILLFTIWLMAIKTLIELCFMIPVAKFFRLESLLLYFPLMQPCHILYTIVAGWLGKFGTYQWKSRTVR